jgi:rubrerythrin
MARAGQPGGVAATGPTRMSRSGLLGASAAVLAATGAGAAALAGARTRGAPAARDREVLQFALELEQLQVAFYGAALRAGNLTGETRQFAEVVGGEEQKHLRYVRRALGSPAAAAGEFDFGDATTDDQRFIKAAVLLEHTGLAAYNGQVGNVSRPTLRAISRVLSVEARHVAWARGIAGEVPAPEATDTPITAQAAMQALRSFRGSGTS